MFTLSASVKPYRPSQRGFSLIELLIVVAIIGIIAALTVPNFISSRRAAEAASAVSSLRLIHSSEASYRTVSGTYGDLTTLGDAGYIADPSLQSGTKSGYLFTVTPDSDPTASYRAKALPTSNSTTRRHYFVDTTGVLRFEMGAEATSASPAIDQRLSDSAQATTPP